MSNGHDWLVHLRCHGLKRVKISDVVNQVIILSILLIVHKSSEVSSIAEMFHVSWTQVYKLNFILLIKSSQESLQVFRVVGGQCVVPVLAVHLDVADVVVDTREVV